MGEMNQLSPFPLSSSTFVIHTQNCSRMFELTGGIPQLLGLKPRSESSTGRIRFNAPGAPAG